MPRQKPPKPTSSEEPGTTAPSHLAIVRMPEVGKRLRHDWNERLDGAAGLRRVDECRIAMWSISDLQRDYATVALAAEVCWDNGVLSLARVISEDWAHRAQRLTQGLLPREALPPRVLAMVLRARMEHRAQNYKLALVHARAALRLLYLTGGGQERVQAAIAEDSEGEFASLMVAILAIAIPAARLTGEPLDTRAERLQEMLAVAIPLVDRERPLAHERIHGLVSQSLYAIAERGRPEDVPLLGRLARNDLLVRPDHKRGQITLDLIGVADAAHRGDEDARASLSARVLEALEGAGLRRHRDTVVEHGWVKAA
jgi:hypothetical protein